MSNFYTQAVDGYVSELQTMFDARGITLNSVPDILTDDIHPGGRRVVPYQVVGTQNSELVYEDITEVNISFKSIYLIGNKRGESDLQVLEATMINLRTLINDRLDTPKLAVFASDISPLLIMSLK